VRFRVCSSYIPTAPTRLHFILYSSEGIISAQCQQYNKISEIFELPIPPEVSAGTIYLTVYGKCHFDYDQLHRMLPLIGDSIAFELVDNSDIVSLSLADDNNAISQNFSESTVTVELAIKGLKEDVKTVPISLTESTDNKVSNPLKPYATRSHRTSLRLFEDGIDIVTNYLKHTEIIPEFNHPFVSKLQTQLNLVDCKKRKLRVI